MRNFSFDVGADGIGLLTWDMPGKSMNTIDLSTLDDLDEFLSRVVSSPEIKGAIITSAKPTFSGGADLSMLAGAAHSAEAVRQTAGRLSQFLRKLETAGKPVAAAINGTALGGAFELCLACHYRVARPDNAARLGLPESKVGLLPGAGGTQRLPRLIGAKEALALMLKGATVDAATALKLGAIHAVAGDPVAAARQWIMEGGKAVQPWDMPGYRVPGGAPQSPQGFPIWVGANALYRKQTYDNYDAQRAILACVYEGLSVKTIEAGLAIELRHFIKLMLGRQAKAMMRSQFLSLQELNKGARRPPAPKSKVGKLGIAGAGFMGAGIAYVSALAGIDVVLLDREQALADKGKAHSSGLLSRGGLGAAEQERILARILPTIDYAAFADCDLVIEAVFENKEIKADAWRKIDAVLPPGALRASNTSTLPISGLAAHVGDATGFVGIHFFSPVDRMQLVEIIRGQKTSPETIARAHDYVRQIGKTPIVVNDSLGFFTSRVVTTHIAEGAWLLEEGVPAALIENAGRLAGMPVGPLALADEIALDLAWRIQLAAKAELGPEFVVGANDRVLEEMVVKRQRLGRKNGAGYYDYPPGGTKRLWPGLAQVAPPKAADLFDVKTIGERLLLIQALETTRCFAENVLTDVREADAGAILGFGFAPFTGGPLSWIDGLGTRAFVERCRRYADAHGARYAPPGLLVDMAAQDETFYGRFAPGLPHAA